MSTHPVPSCILAAVDYSDTASLVVQEAVELARQKRAAQLHFLHVNHAPPADAGQQARHAELLEWLGARLQGHPGVARELRVVGHELSGDAAKLIVETAADVGADVVVVGTHGRKGMQRLLLGSVAAAVVQNCGCPVFVLRPKRHDHPEVQIEPPCPRCMEARAQSEGQVFWCSQHAEKHGRRHTYFDPHASSWVSQRIVP
jgi:nucleotide-binding universal stress UspA family protein